MAISNFNYENINPSAIQLWVEWKHISIGKTHCQTCLKLDNHGQRINITVTLPRRVGTGTVSFTTGWMVNQKGQISLITPYGDN